MSTKIWKISQNAERVIKNQWFEPSKIIKKSIKKWYKNRSFFWFIFYRFLVDVGPMLGPKILIKSMKNQVKNEIKQWLFFCFILCWFLVDFGSKLGGPREALGGPFPPPWGSWLALGPKMAPRPPQEASQDRFLSPTWPPDPLQETQLSPTWLQQGPYLAPSRTQLDTKSSHNSHHRNVHTQKPRACIKDQTKRRGRRWPPGGS